MKTASVSAVAHFTEERFTTLNHIAFSLFFSGVVKFIHH